MINTATDPIPASTLEHIPLSDNALTVLRERYLAKDDQGNIIETADQLWERVAREIAGVETLYDVTAEEVASIQGQFRQMLATRKFLPNSPTLMNAGRPGAHKQYSACFVIPIEDDMQSIGNAVTAALLIHKCLVPETLVMTDDGLIRLDEVTPSHRVATDEKPYPVSRKHDNGQQPVFSVQTEHGYALTGTEQHRLLVIGTDGYPTWKQIRELRPGDWVILRIGEWLGSNRGLPDIPVSGKEGRNQTSFKARSIALPTHLSEELAEFIGFYIGDGVNHRDGIRFSVGGEDADMIPHLTQLGRTLSHPGHD